MQRKVLYFTDELQMRSYLYGVLTINVLIDITAVAIMNKQKNKWRQIKEGWFM